MKTPLKNIQVVVIAVVLLVAGIGAGFAVGFVVYQPQISSLQGDVSDLEGDVSVLEDQISSLQGQNSLLEGQVSDLEGDVSDLQAQLVDANTVRTQLLSQISNLTSQIADLQDQISTLQATIAYLEEQLKLEIEIGALLPLTGVLATFGENEKVVAEFAVEEVNEFLQASGANWTLKIIFEDTQTDPALALEKVESLAARGIELIVGPLSSAEVRAIKGYCDSNKILAISQSSIAPDLAIPDDYIYRFCPTDRYGQGPAIARIMYDDGKRYVIPVTRNDAWGAGLEEAVEKKFVGDLGGTFLPGILYATDAMEFSAEAADLDYKVRSALATYPAAEVAILHISFEEVVAFMTACFDYPVLDDVKWYGSDGTAVSGAMLDDPDVRDFAMTVEYPCTIFGPAPSVKREMVRQHVIDVLGREPEPYSYVVYDIVWVYALSLLEVDASPGAVKVVLPTVTQDYIGASGRIELDENGDRKAGDYDIWQIVEVSPGTYDWTVVGAYILTTDSVVWY